MHKSTIFFSLLTLGIGSVGLRAMEKEIDVIMKQNNEVLEINRQYIVGSTQFVWSPTRKPMGELFLQSKKDKIGVTLNVVGDSERSLETSTKYLGTRDKEEQQKLKNELDLLKNDATVMGLALIRGDKFTRSLLSRDYEEDYHLCGNGAALVGGNRGNTFGKLSYGILEKLLALSQPKKDKSSLQKDKSSDESSDEDSD